MAIVRPKRPRDANQLAWQIVQESTGQQAKQAPESLPEPPQTARAGALGGHARARSLGPKKRTAIAKVAAAARWKKR